MWLDEHDWLYSLLRSKDNVSPTFRFPDLISASVSPIPAAKDAPFKASVHGAVSREMSSVNHRFFNNAYFRSVDALLLLASYRLSTLLEWLPWLGAFVLAAIADG